MAARIPSSIDLFSPSGTGCFFILIAFVGSMAYAAGQTMTYFFTGIDDPFLGIEVANILAGNGGDDTLLGGAVLDILNGGAGSDISSFSAGDDRDKIIGFKNEVDTLDFGVSGVDAVLDKAYGLGGFTMFDFGG